MLAKRFLFYIAFFTVLVLGFYFALSAIIPGFEKKRYPPISTVQPFAFTNQDGKVFTEKNMEGKVAVVNFFFTTCTSVCPKMNGYLKEKHELFKNNPDVLFLSFTSDPAKDSAAQLKKYAERMQINTSNWVFLTGRKDSLYRAARHSFKVDDPSNFVTSGDVDFLHTQFVALVNKKGEVVKIYDGLKPSELNTMEGDIKNLLKE